MLIQNTNEKQIKEFWNTLGDEIRTIDSVGGFSIDELLHKSVFIHGVTENGNLKGIGGLFKSLGFLWTFHMVKKEYQRQGVADEITREFLKYAKDKTIILASIFPWNDATVRMTRKQGYKIMYRGKDLWWLYIPLKPHAEVYAKILPYFIRFYNYKLTRLILRYIHQLKVRGFVQSLKMLFIYLFQNMLTPLEYGWFLSSKEYKLRLNILKQFRFIHRHINCLHTEGELLHIADYLLKLPVDLKGDIVECGTYDGGATCKLSYLATILNRKVIACDSFEGLQNIINSENPYFKLGDYKSLYDKFMHNINTYGVAESVQVLPGWFNETLPKVNSNIVCIFEDADIYNSVKDVLSILWNRLQKDCCVFTHEMLFPPALKAYKENGLQVKQVGCWLTNSNLGYVKKGG